jgi:predicted RNase H-like nuclease
MAYVVARDGRRYEVRESSSTPRGPRARTLATFATLDDDTLAQVHERATTAIDDAALLRSARKAGAPVTVGQSPADRAARALLAQLNAGHGPAPILAAALEDALGAARESRRKRALPDPVRAAMAWAGSSLAERGEALRDLLLLADRLPVPASR